MPLKGFTDFPGGKMSDGTPQQEAVVEEPTTVEAEPKSFDEAYVKKLRDEAAGYRVKLKEYEDRDKSEAEKSAERIAELERENIGLRSEVERGGWLRDASKETGLSVDALDAIRGDDRDSFMEAAQKIKSLIPEARTVIPGDAEPNALPLNGDGVETALRKALGI